jgi:MFS family permease
MSAISAGASTKVSPYAWWVMVVLAFAMVVSYVDRQIIALVVEPMKDDLGYTDTQTGFLYAGFAIFYAAAGIPIAWLVDHKSRRGIVAWGVFLWSLATMVCGLVKGYWALFAARIGVGVGEATLTPATFSIVSDLFPRERIPTALSIFQLGAIVGTGLAFLVGGYVVSWVRHAPPVDVPLIGEIFSWQMTFIYVAAPGLLVLLLFLTIKEPIRKQTKQIEGAAAKGSWDQVWEFYGQNWSALWRHHVGYMFLILLGYAFVFWTPSFFERVHDVPAEEASKIYGAIFIFFGGGGALCAGWFAERLARNGRPDGTLIGAVIGASLFVPVVVIIQFVPNVMWVYVLYAPALFLMNTPFGLGQAALVQITPPDIKGRVAAIYTIMGACGNALGPPIAGFFNDVVFPEEGGISSSLMTMCIFFGAVGVILVWLSRKPFRASLARAQLMDADS